VLTEITTPVTDDGAFSDAGPGVTTDMAAKVLASMVLHEVVKHEAEDVMMDWETTSTISDC
jgi:hypothetical protein